MLHWKNKNKLKYWRKRGWETSCELFSRVLGLLPQLSVCLIFDCCSGWCGCPGVMSSVLLILVNNNPLIAMHWTSGQKLNIIRITRDSAEKHSSPIIPDSPDTNQMFHTFQRVQSLQHFSPPPSPNWRIKHFRNICLLCVGSWLVSNQRKTFAGSFQYVIHSFCVVAV